MMNLLTPLQPTFFAEDDLRCTSRTQHAWVTCCAIQCGADTSVWCVLSSRVQNDGSNCHGHDIVRAGKDRCVWPSCASVCMCVH